MKNLHAWISTAALIAGLSFTSLTQATSINVLWYTYADPASEYRQKISQLSNIVHMLPQSDGSSWNLTYWEAGGATPDLVEFDVLVIESGEAFDTGAPGGPSATPDYSGILNNKAAIEAARGDRAVITAADSDFHAIRGDTGNIPGDPETSAGGRRCAPVLTSPHCWDGALGHLVNAVNWAAGGNGVGIVSFLDGEHPGSFWWVDENSFLRSELDGRVIYAGSEQNPIINPLQATHPLNSGLTSKGLSDWNNSFHAFFLPVEGYTQIVGSSLRPGYSVAIATSVPELPNLCEDIDGPWLDGDDHSPHKKYVP
ncbi:MAG: PEP-CTERM sorting domain-containing protein [Pseudomonadota bacterium]|nr:PEP-CTERM sorting domain-containing protein [Pseudomonadota bacterium]